MKILFKGGKIYPITQKPFEGDILVEDGKIKAMGENLKDSNAEIIDVKG